MTTRRYIAMLWGAILVIACLLAPSAVRAHASHDHAQHHPVAVAHHHQDDHANPAHSATARAVAAVTFVEAATDLPSSGLPATGCATCNGTCCGGGSSCCGSFIPSALLVHSAPPIGRGALLMPTASTDLGRDPEILPRPPKSFA